MVQVYLQYFILNKNDQYQLYYHVSNIWCQNVSFDIADSSAALALLDDIINATPSFLMNFDDDNIDEFGFKLNINEDMCN